MTAQNRDDPTQQRGRPVSVVYLIQEPSIPKGNGRVLDISPLYQWGDIRMVMERSQMASFNPAAALMQVRSRLKDFRSDTDYIAVAGGDTLAVLMVGSVLRDMGLDHFTYLRFERTRLPDGSRDPSSGVYVRVRVPLTGDAAMEAISGQGHPPQETPRR